MAKTSAGILVYRLSRGFIEVLLAHPGGPFYRHKDSGVWTIPKGEYTEDEDALTAAQREFTEETGLVLSGKFRSLTPIKQKSGKIVTAWAIETDIDPSAIQSNTFPLEWPPKSGKTELFPEIDKAEWMSLVVAQTKMLPAQLPLLAELKKLID
jgi:predicted NUDIX family NTP pyrophosphohydrolase